MATRAKAFTAHIYAYDSATGAPKTGDSANITPRLAKDGTSAALTTTTVTELDATNFPGAYKVSISGTEADCDALVVGGKSSTSGVYIVPTVYQMERLPDAAPDAAGGVRDVARVAGTAQTARDLGAQLDATVSSRLAAASYTAPLDAAGTRSAVGLASANLDTQLAALPTAAENRAEMDASSVGLAAIFARTDVATSTRLAGSSYVAPLDATATQSAAAAALTAYDPPTRTEATSDKDAILARLGTPANADLAADIAAVLTSIALRATPAQVATEIADALRADSGTELSSPPAKDAPVAAQVQWLFQALRNGGTQTATARTTRNDAGSTTGTQAVSDDGTTLVLGKAS